MDVLPGSVLGDLGLSRRDCDDCRRRIQETLKGTDARVLFKRTTTHDTPYFDFRRECGKGDDMDDWTTVFQGIMQACLFFLASRGKTKRRNELP